MNIKRHAFQKLFLIVTLVMSITVAPVSILAEAEVAEIEVTDMIDREISLEAPATTVVATTPSDAEVLYALGLGDLVVGRGTYVDYPAEIMEVDDIGSGEETNIEAIIALDPDLVIMGYMFGVEEQIEQLDAAGINVYVSQVNSIEEIYENIENIGLLTDSSDAATELIEEMEATFEEYEELADDQEPGSVYYEISPLEFGLWAGGEDTFMDELGDMLNLENIFDDLEGWGEVSEEQVISLNPDYIITTSFPGPDMTAEEEIMSRDGWADINAVANELVFAVDSNEFTRPGPRLMDAIEQLYTLVYGE